MKINLFKTLAALVLVTIAACSTTQDQTEELMSASVPTDLTILFGEGGGATGRWTGHVIEADGSVFDWQGMELGANREAAGALDLDDLGVLLARITESGFYDTQQNERGNLTRLVRITSQGETHEVSWVPQMDLSGPAQPSTSDRVLTLLLETVKQAR